MSKWCFRAETLIYSVSLGLATLALLAASLFVPRGVGNYDPY